MTQAEVLSFTQSFERLASQDLIKLKEQIDRQLEEIYERKENFYLHEKIDDYIYIVHYLDGHTHMDYIGARSYNEYISNEDAIKIERKTKDLFPTYETLMEKGLAQA